MIEFTDRDYFRTHGTKPRGDGQWAFRIAGEVWWANGTLTAAKAQIRKRILATTPADVDKRAGYVLVEVLG